MHIVENTNVLIYCHIIYMRENGNNTDNTEFGIYFPRDTENESNKCKPQQIFLLYYY